MDVCVNLNIKKYVDLHVHTDCSDEEFSSSKVVEMSKDTGLCTVAITDHFTVSGIPEAIAKGNDYGGRSNSRN